MSATLSYNHLKLLSRLKTISLFLLCALGFSTYAPAQSQKSASDISNGLFIAERGILDPRSLGIEEGMLSAVDDADVYFRLYAIHPDLWMDSTTDIHKPVEQWLPASGQVDFVMASWISDLEFALEHYPKDPLINLSPRVISEHTAVTNIGQDFAERVAKTLSWYTAIRPFTGSVHVVLGDFSTNSQSASIIPTQLDALGVDEARIRWITARNPEAILRQVRGLTSKDLLMFLPLTELEGGRRYNPVPLSHSLAASTQAPLITFWKGLSGSALGGYLANPSLLGQEAIRAYTTWKTTGQFPKEYQTSEWRFNYEQLERFGVSLDSLPEGSLIIGQTPPIISKEAWWLIALGALLGLTGTLGTWYWGAYHRRLNKQLEQKDLELTEALQAGLAHVEQLRASQEQIQLAIDMAALDIVQIDFDAEQIRVDGSESWLSLAEWGSNLGISNDHLNAILRLVHMPYVPIEIDAVRKSGTGAKEMRFRVMVSEPVAQNRVHVQYAMLQDISAWMQIRTRAASAEDDRRRVTLSLAGVRKDLNSLLAERDRLAEALHHAQKDALTDLLTRRSWAKFAAIEVDQLQSMDGRQSALLFLDLDHFKSINDTYGHNIGDQALAHFAGIAGDGLRNRDLLGRWGGEEFILILPATNEEQALIVAERIRETLYTTPLRVDGTVVKMSVSIGVAAYHKQYATLEAWVDAADKAAYFAKASGRNTVRTASVRE